jgi:xanthine permease XanP
MMRPSNLIYGVDDRPPALISFANAAQQLTIVTPIFIYTILVMREGGASEDAIAQAVSLTFIVCGAAVVLQAFPSRWTGSGYLISIGPAAPYIPISIAAIKGGGLPLLAGMTLLAGLFEVVFAQIVRRLRPFFPAEISGLCILLIGIFIGVLAIRIGLGVDAATLQTTASAIELSITAGTLALMIGLNLWGKGVLRMLSAIIGIVCGYAAAVALGVSDPASMRVLAAAPLFELPRLQPNLPTFAPELIIPFMAAALTCALRGMGDISAAQKINDREWVRPEMTSIRKGITANGLATMFAGAIGVIGGNTQSSSIGMSNAAGVTSRWVSYWLGGLLILFSVFPAVPAVLIATPRSVIGASFLFTSCFIVVSGLQIITSRLLDPRRTFIIGIALTLSLGHEIFPGIYRNAPAVLQPFVSSGLVVGLISALALNALFRIGMRTSASVMIEPVSNVHDQVRAFLEQQGAKWGARRDVIERAVFGTAQSVETIIDHCNVQGPVAVEASFDEFNLDVRVTYQGDDFQLSDRRPTDEQIRDSDDGLRLLAGYLVQQNADRVRASRKGDRAQVEFHYQH